MYFKKIEEKHSKTTITHLERLKTMKNDKNCILNVILMPDSFRILLACFINLFRSSNSKNQWYSYWKNFNNLKLLFSNLNKIEKKIKYVIKQFKYENQRHKTKSKHRLHICFIFVCRFWSFHYKIMQQTLFYEL